MAFLHEVTIDGRQCLLVLAPLDWAVRPKTSHLFSTDESEGKSGIDTTASEWAAMRIAVDYYYSLPPLIADEWVSDTLALGKRLLALPLAFDDLATAEYTEVLRIYSPAHFVNYDPETGAFAVDVAAGYSQTASLVLCSLVDEPKIVARTDMHGTVQLRGEEDSPFSARVQVNTIAAPSFVWDPEWTSPPEVLARTQLKRRTLGPGRERMVVNEESPKKRGQKAGLVFQSREEIRAILSFWVAKRGAAQAFTAPIWFTPGWDGTGAAPTFNARFGQDALTLEALTQDHAKTTVTLWQQLILVGGQPDQRVPDRAFLLKLWWTGSTNKFLWSDWESPITHATLTYTRAVGLELRPPSETLKPGDNDWEFMLEDFDGNPMRAFTLLALERTLNIEIRECDPSNPAGAALRHVGEITKAPSKGRLYTVTSALIGGRLRKLVPDCYCQPNCNNTLYDENCRLDQAAHEQTGNLASFTGDSVNVTTAAAQAADYFAEGIAEFGVGDALERRWIVRSEPIAGGQRLKLHRPLRAVAVAATVKFYPGCDGQFFGGCAKLNNQDNFFGMPHQPADEDSVATGFTPKVGGK